MAFADTTIIIPTFNEQGNVQVMIRTLLKLYPQARILISDGNSTDRTIQEVKQEMKKSKVVKLIINKTKQKGLTKDVLSAVEKVTTTYLVVMDCDFQHNPNKIKEIITALRQGNDIVIAAREYLPKKWPWTRKLISKTASLMGKTRLFVNSVHAEDVLSGFFGVDTAYFKRKITEHPNSFVPEGYKVLFDLLKLSRKAKIDKVMYVFGLRTRGESKIGSKQIFAFLKSLQ